jgi:hypothetical protein
MLGKSFISGTGQGAFNGGRSQVGFNSAGGSSGGYEFLNILKGAPAWSVFDNSSNPVPPDILDTNGYPLAIQNGGVKVSLPIPSQTARPGNYCVTWDGTGTISCGAGGSTLTSKTFTGSISGNILTVPGSITGGPFQFGERVTGTGVLANTIIMNQTGATTYTVSKSQTVASTSMTASGGSSSSSGTTDAGFFACTVATSLLIFSITTLPSAPSNYISNVQIFHVDDAALLQAGNVFGQQFKARLAAANFGIYRFLNWQDGNITNITNWASRKSTSHWSWTAYEHRNSIYCGATTNVSSAYSAAAPSAWPGTVAGRPPDKTMVTVKFNASSASTAPTLKITGGSGGDTGDITILNEYSNALSSGTNSLIEGGSFRSVATLVYDAKLDGWIKQGGDIAEGSQGIGNGVPFEIMLRLCREMGAHPCFILPPLAMDPMTDFVPELANFLKINKPSWMIPQIEGPNETWNTGAGFYQTTYASNIAAINWVGGNYHSEYGKWMSTIGQACAAVFGLANLGVTYHVVCGVQTSTGGSTSTSDERLSSAKYVAQAAAAQSLTWSGGTINFTKSAASGWVSHVCCATYISPTRRYTTQDLTDGFSYSVTNRGNSSAQATIATDYVDTLVGAADGHFNLSQCSAYYTAWKAWAAGFGVTRMCAYEGGYSPDNLQGLAGGNPTNTAWYSSVIGATKDATGCVLTLSATCNNSEFSNISGNPGAAGMAVVMSGVGGMTQLNNPGVRSVTFAGGGSANISGTNTLILNQAVYFLGTLPSELTTDLRIQAQNGSANQSIPYYVVSAGNPFQISATRGGAAITFNSVGSGVTAQECWFVLSVPTGTTMKLDVDSSTFSTYTSSGFAVYVNSMNYSNNLRYAGKLASNLQGYTTTNYNNFTSAGGEFPSAYNITGPTPSVNIWSFVEDVYETPNQPQMTAIIAYNH